MSCWLREVWVLVLGVGAVQFLMMMLRFFWGVSLLLVQREKKDDDSIVAAASGRNFNLFLRVCVEEKADKTHHS